MKQINSRYLHFLFSGILFFVVKSNAQKIDTISTFSITTYIDAYYAHYTDSVAPGDYQKFAAANPRNNTPSLNTAMISMVYNADKIRGTAVLHYGDIAAANWAPAPYNNIMEAHLGFKIYSKLWIDAGFFRGHFGTEFLLPAENITSTVAVATFYEPVLESGVRLNFDPTKKLEINLFLLNGYNMFVDNNNKKSFGMGVTYALADKGGIGYTNYIGDDSPPALSAPSHLRIEQNVFLNYQVKKVKLQIGADQCLQQNSDIATNKKNASMYSALATAKYQFAKKAAIYGRGEIFKDPEGVMSPIITDRAGNKTGYKLLNVTAGFEFKPTEESYVRIENRYIMMDKDQYIFLNSGTGQNKRYEIMVNAGVTFDLLKNVMTRKGE